MNGLIHKSAAINACMESYGYPPDRYELYNVGLRDAQYSIQDIPEVELNPLVWESVSGYLNSMRAPALGGWYYITDDEDSCMGAMFVEFVLTEDAVNTIYAQDIHRGSSEEDAMNAAKADYESRIRLSLNL